MGMGRWIAEMANSRVPVVEARGGSCSHRRKEDHFHLVSGASIANISFPAINPQIYFLLLPLTFNLGYISKETPLCLLLIHTR